MFLWKLTPYKYECWFKSILEHLFKQATKLIFQMLLTQAETCAEGKFLQPSVMGQVTLTETFCASIGQSTAFDPCRTKVKFLVQLII